MGRKKIYTDEEIRAKRKEYQANYYKKNKEKLVDFLLKNNADPFKLNKVS